MQIGLKAERAAFTNALRRSLPTRVTFHPVPLALSPSPRARRAVIGARVTRARLPRP